MCLRHIRATVEYVDISELFDGYGPVAGFDEMFEGVDVRDNYGTIHESFLFVLTNTRGMNALRPLW